MTRKIASIPPRSGTTRSTAPSSRTSFPDVKDILAEAKGAGFDVVALRQIIKMRRQDS
jgi:hypothetical protein